jgi:outer membrane lipoprotein-sorting protein
MSRRWVRWMPAAAMPALVAGVVLAGPLQAQAPATMPARTAAQVLALAIGSHPQPLSGTLDETVDLGLPQLPATGPGGASSQAGGSGTAAGLGQLVEFLTAPHTARVYLDGAGSQRIQLLDSLAERDVVHHGTTVWTYDSAANTATKYTVSNPLRPGAATGGLATPNSRPVPGVATVPPMAPHDAKQVPGPPVQTPAAVAADILKNLDPGTAVSLGANEAVAGQPAYTLQLVPRTPTTLVAKVTIAVDANNGMPLRVTVQARGQNKAAFEVGFSQLTLAAPPSSMFNFTPPPGTTVTAGTLPLPRRSSGKTLDGGTAAAATSGTGWATILRAPAGTVPASMTSAPALARLLQAVPGGQALSTSLFTVLVTPDGALYAGAVPLAALQQAAAAP